MNLFQMKIDSPIGPLYLVASAKSFRGLFWKKQNIPLVSNQEKLEEKLLKKTATQLEEYFKGKRKTFDIPLEAEGTEFQKQVWKALASIPYGETRSYKDIAILVKNVKACRAVGTAIGKNPWGIIIPCHRVIASDGSLGGFAGGLTIKKKLLQIEA